MPTGHIGRSGYSIDDDGDLLWCDADVGSEEFPPVVTQHDDMPRPVQGQPEGLPAHPRQTGIEFVKVGAVHMHDHRNAEDVPDQDQHALAQRAAIGSHVYMQEVNPANGTQP